MTHRGFISSVLMMSLASVFGATATTSTKYPYKDANLPIETRINDLLQRMATSGITKRTTLMSVNT